MDDRRGQHLGVPAYFLPGPAWRAASRKGAAVRYLVVNPASGPGGSADDRYRRATARARASGIQVLGYVDTTYGERGLVPVREEIDRYRDWYGVDGIFLDQAAATDGALSYYERLAGHVRPGVLALNPGVYPSEAYLGLADVLVTFEGDFATYVHCEVPAWAAEHPRHCFWHLVYATNRGQLDSALTLARRRRAGVVYVTDRNLGNPWDGLASYWQTEVKIAARPQEASSA